MPRIRGIAKLIRTTSCRYQKKIKLLQIGTKMRLNFIENQIARMFQLVEIGTMIISMAFANDMDIEFEF